MGGGGGSLLGAAPKYPKCWVLCHGSSEGEGGREALTLHRQVALFVWTPGKAPTQQRFSGSDSLLKSPRKEPGAGSRPAPSCTLAAPDPTAVQGHVPDREPETHRAAYGPLLAACAVSETVPALRRTRGGPQRHHSQQPRDGKDQDVHRRLAHPRDGTQLGREERVTRATLCTSLGNTILRGGPEMESRS